MAQDLFGYQITKTTKLPDLEEDKKLLAITPRTDDDGSLTVVSGNVFGQVIDVDGMIKSDSELITRYRSMSDHPAINLAITSIVNEAIINEPEEDTVKIDLSDTKFPKNLQSKIEDEFDNILNLLNFENMGYEMFRRWYIDGRIYYHAMIDFGKPGLGIQELRYIDPRKIRRVKEIKVQPTSSNQSSTDANIMQPIADYYLFNENGFGKDDASRFAGQTPYAQNTFKISKDAIINVTSGLMDTTGKNVVSYLHKAVIPLNKLNMLEQAVIIYRLVRAPERRVFTVDVSGMQPQKAEQYLNSLITNAKNKVMYDPATGQLSDQRKFATMTEDHWLPTRDGKGTKIDTLPGGENLGRMEDVEYFQKELYKALEVPQSRLTADDTYSLGRATEISREEIAFEKFITRLRSRFSQVILKSLRLQLLLKRIITPEDWDQNVNLIDVVYAKDNLFAELKNNEVMMGRINLMTMIAPFVGRYYSDQYVRKTIAKQTSEEIDEMDKQIKEDQDNPQYLESLSDSMNPGIGGLPAPDSGPGSGQMQLPAPQAAPQ